MKQTLTTGTLSTMISLHSHSVTALAGHRSMVKQCGAQQSSSSFLLVTFNGLYTFAMN